MTLNNWKEEFDKKFSDLYPEDNIYLIQEDIESFISSLLEQQRKEVLDVIEEQKGQFSSEEMRDRYYVLETITSLINKQ